MTFLFHFITGIIARRKLRKAAAQSKADNRFTASQLEAFAAKIQADKIKRP